VTRCSEKQVPGLGSPSPSRSWTPRVAPGRARVTQRALPRIPPPRLRCPGALHAVAPPPDDAGVRAHAQQVAAGCAVIGMNGEDSAVKSPDDDDAFTIASTPAPSTSSERKKPERRAREWWREEYYGCRMDSASHLHFPFPTTSLGSPLCFVLLTKR
jgi:hypothetical protein